MHRLSSTLVGAILLTCGGSPPDPVDRSEGLRETPPLQAMASSLPRTETVPDGLSRGSLEDAYQGWQAWCEPFDYDVACSTHSDCEEAHQGHPAKRPMRCFNPWYAQERPDYKVCAPGHAGKRERAWRQDRLREVIRQQYFGETNHCKLDGRPMWKEGWRCQKASAHGDKLLAFLWIGYMRETTARPWKRHRLDADVKASKTAWFKMAEEYGWHIETDKYGEPIKYEPVNADANPYYGERYRWHFGLGPIGQNAPLWVHNWDVKAPPEILCREVEPFEAYLRRARKALTTLRHGIRCGGEYYEDKQPTWETLHRAINLGSMCPASTSRHRRGLSRFRKHAAREGLNPDEVVTLGMLGDPIEVEAQNERAAEIYAALESKFPTMQ